MASYLLELWEKAVRHQRCRMKRKSYHQALAGAIGRRQITGRHLLNLQIQTVSACNAACVFCPYQESWHKSHPGTMTAAMYRNIIDETSAYSIGKFCPYLENEPLLDPFLFDRIEYARTRLNFRLLEISTNASLLSGKKIEQIAELFCGIDHEIWISFHGIDRESFNAVMGLNFDQCRENVLALVEKSQTRELRLIIRGAGFARKNRADYPAWFNRKQYLEFWNSEFKKHHFRKVPEVRFFTYHDRAGQIRRNRINFACSLRPTLEGFYCHRVDQWLHFLYTGELILCCMDYHRCTVFGDLRTSSLAEVLESDEFISLASQTAGLAASPDDFLCKRCISPGDGMYDGK